MTPQEAEKTVPPHQDIRSELFENLKTEFTAALNADATLSEAAKAALVEWVDSDDPTADEVIAAISKNDPVEEELRND